MIFRFNTNAYGNWVSLRGIWFTIWFTGLSIIYFLKSFSILCHLDLYLLCLLMLSNKKVYGKQFFKVTVCKCIYVYILVFVLVNVCYPYLLAEKRLWLCTAFQWWECGYLPSPLTPEVLWSFT